MYTITAKQMKELYDSIDKSCEWSEQVFGWYGKNMLDGLDCNVTQYILDEAKKEANLTQLKLINYIFRPKYKEGDWVIFTKDYGDINVIFNKGDIKQIKFQDGIGLYIWNTVLYGHYDLTNYFKLTTPEEIERSQIKDGDLVWVTDTKNHWGLNIATGEFNYLGKIITGGEAKLTWKHYKKASQAVVDEYNSLNKE